MVKHTQRNGRLLPTNCLSAFDHFVGLTLKGLIYYLKRNWELIKDVFQIVYYFCRASFHIMYQDFF